PTPAPNHSRRWVIPVALVGVAALAGAGVGFWFLLKPKPVDHPDLVAAAHANAPGIGYMEQFEFPKGIGAFEEAVKLAPEWTPAKINLGIARLNLGKDVPTELDKALAGLKEILEKEPDNPHAHYCTGIIHYHRGQLDAALPHFESVTRIDPNDAHAWLFRAQAIRDSSESPEARRCLEPARKRTPTLTAPGYGRPYPGLPAPARRQERVNGAGALKAAGWEPLAAVNPAEMGHYAEVIGKAPAPAPELGAVPM